MYQKWRHSELKIYRSKFFKAIPLEFQRFCKSAPILTKFGMYHSWTNRSYLLEAHNAESKIDWVISKKRWAIVNKVLHFQFYVNMCNNEVVGNWKIWHVYIYNFAKKSLSKKIL